MKYYESIHISKFKFNSSRACSSKIAIKRNRVTCANIIIIRAENKQKFVENQHVTRVRDENTNVFVHITNIII